MESGKHIKSRNYMQDIPCSSMGKFHRHLIPSFISWIYLPFHNLPPISDLWLCRQIVHISIFMWTCTWKWREWHYSIHQKTSRIRFYFWLFQGHVKRELNHFPFRESIEVIPSVWIGIIPLCYLIFTHLENMQRLNYNTLHTRISCLLANPTVFINVHILCDPRARAE